VFSLQCTKVCYCVQKHNEEQVRYVMQCNETHLRCFLFTAQRLVIACLCITRNKLNMSCNAMKRTHLRCFLFTAQRLFIACICITRNKLDMSCNTLKHILGVFFSLHRGYLLRAYVMQCTETHLRCFLFIAQKLIIACICITRNKLDMSCNALKHILGVFFSLHRG